MDAYMVDGNYSPTPISKGLKDVVDHVRVSREAAAQQDYYAEEVLYQVIDEKELSKILKSIKSNSS